MDVTTDKSAVVAAVRVAALSLGYQHLKEKQIEAACQVLSGKDTFVALPTGCGKSILPRAFDKLQGKWLAKNSIFKIHTSFLLGNKGSIVVCISPLTSIMMDQRAKFAPLGLSTEFVGEAQEDPTATRRVLEGKIQLVYISPEAILKNWHYRHMLLSEAYKEKLVALAIDEAHCIKTW